MNSFKIIDTGKSKVDVCIAMLAYNHEKYIGQAIESILMQETNFSYKIIIAEDFSTDRTAEIILKYQKQYPDIIKLIFQNKNVGAAKNNFDLLNNLEGKYVAALEGDDYWTDPLKLQKQVDFLEANSDYVLCFHPIEILKTDGTIVDDFITKVPENYETIETLARLGNYIHTPSVVFRNVIKEFPFELELSPIGDYFLYMILAEYGKLKWLEDKMAVYRYGVGIYSGSSHSSKIENDLIKFGCMLSYSKNTKIKQILFDRYLLAVDVFLRNINNHGNNGITSVPFALRAYNSVKFYYKNPIKIIKKIYYNILMSKK